MSDPQVPLQETLMALSGQRKKKVDDGGTGYAPESPREYGSIAPSHIPEPGTAEDKETKSREWERQVDQPIESEDPISDGIMAADGIGALVRGATLSKIAEQMARAKSKSAGAHMTAGMADAADPVAVSAMRPIRPGAPSVSFGPQDLMSKSTDDIMSQFQSLPPAKAEGALGYLDAAPATGDDSARWDALFKHLEKSGGGEGFIPQAPFERAATPTPSRDISLGHPGQWSEKKTPDLMGILEGRPPQEQTVAAKKRFANGSR